MCFIYFQMYSHSMCESAPPWLMVSLHGTGVIASITIKAFWTISNFLCLMSQKGEWLLFVQNVFNFIIYINWLLVLYDQSKSPCLLRYSVDQLQTTLAGGSSLRQIFRACTSSGYVPLPLSADSQSTACRGGSVVVLHCVLCYHINRGFTLSFEKRYFWPQS